MRLDSHNQPPQAINRSARVTRTCSELLGLVRGLVADGQVVDEEIEYLARWFTANPEASASWPFNHLLRRVAAALEDGRIDDDERDELHAIMLDITGHSKHEYLVNESTAFPLTRPEPEVIFDRNEFVLTGRFAYGVRRKCEEEILVRGGTCCDTVTLRTSYLVIGDLSSRDWAQSSWGRKIEAAARYAQHHPVHIITERRWADFLLPA